MKIEWVADKDGDNWGHYDGDEQQITIYLKDNKDPMSTLFHECLHAAFGISGQKQHMTTEQEEAYVRCIEKGLYPLYTLTES